MGWTIDKTFQADPSQTGEPDCLIPTHVEGNAISDTIVIRQRASLVVLDLSTLRAILDHLESKGVTF